MFTLALITYRTIIHSKDKSLGKFIGFSHLQESESLSVCFLGCLLGGTSMSPDFRTNLRGRTVFGCTTTPRSVSSMQVLRLMTVWARYSALALNSVQLLFRKMVSLAQEKRVLNAVFILPV